jgi:hypothetical protein
MTERKPYQDHGGLHGLPFECTRLAEVDGRTSHHVCVNHEMLLFEQGHLHPLQMSPLRIKPEK